MAGPEPVSKPALADRRVSGDRRTFPRGGRRADDPCLRTACEAVHLSISEQLGAQIYQQGLSLARTAELAGLSEQGLSDILKTVSDPKACTLVRAALALDCELRITFVPKRTPVQ
jgi:hypothetical protein